MNYYYIGAAISILVILYLYLNKAFHPVRVSEIRYGPEIFLYFQYQGKY